MKHLLELKKWIYQIIGYKIEMQESVTFLYNNKQMENEI